MEKILTLICILITSTILSHAVEDDEQAQIRMQLDFRESFLSGRSFH